MKTWQLLKQNPSLWHRYFFREKVIKEIRSFFDTQGFHEVETPTLIGHPPAESYLELFSTVLLDRKRRATPMYLTTSPEASLKKLMAAGIGNCYSITKSFRNTETGSSTHNPEFTILEWYRVGANYKDIMEDCEKLILHLSSVIPSTTEGSHDPTRSRIPPALKLRRTGKCGMTQKTFMYQNHVIDLTPPWERISVSEAFQKWAHADLEKFFDIETARGVCRNKGYAVNPENTWEELYNQIFLNEIEPHLGKDKPIILYDYPFLMAALAAKKKDADPRYVERFELYVGGLEIGDCCSELTDPIEQEKRFVNETKEIMRLGKTAYEYDKEFIEALKLGLPPCAGIAIGIDRLLMLLTNTTKIADTLFFPLEDLL
ncbi:EF-P lysine aminoacylase EpmA [Patescibacteria group bacterium]|nr:EF-P lysine aminoacylase EpmA [Patescibacteria group bacterium]